MFFNIINVIFLTCVNNIFFRVYYGLLIGPFEPFKTFIPDKALFLRSSCHKGKNAFCKKSYRQLNISNWLRRRWRQFACLLGLLPIIRNNVEMFADRQGNASLIKFWITIVKKTLAFLIVGLVTVAVSSAT